MDREMINPGEEKEKETLGRLPTSPRWAGGTPVYLLDSGVTAKDTR